MDVMWSNARFLFTVVLQSQQGYCRFISHQDWEQTTPYHQAIVHLSDLYNYHQVT